MIETLEKQQSIDQTWREVAAHLAGEWQWTRRRRQERESDPRWGWLQGPEGLCLAVHFNHTRCEIHESLDTLVPGTGERLIVRYLYSSHEQPVSSITVAFGRPAPTIAREIERRLLPSVRESLKRLNARKRDDGALHERRRQAVEAIVQLVPSAYRCPAYSAEAPRLFLGPTVYLDLRIDDSDKITIAQWSGLNLDTVLRLIATALPKDNP